jgi:hypothetical protein
MKSKNFNLVLFLFSLCLIGILVYASCDEKFRIQSGNMLGGRSSSYSSAPSPAPSPAHSPSSSRPHNTDIYNANFGWHPSGFYYPRRRYWHPRYRRYINWVYNRPYYNYANTLDCDNNCCDRNVCYETGGVCEWSINGKYYNGTPEQCVRYKECVGRNMGDESMCGNILNN